MVSDSKRFGLPIRIVKLLLGMSRIVWWLEFQCSKYTKKLKLLGLPSSNGNMWFSRCVKMRLMLSV